MPFNGVGFVAFMDLLGFSARTMESWHAKPSALDVILGLKTRIQERIAVQPRVMIAGRNERWDPTISSISDSIILTYGMRDSSDDVEFFLGLANLQMVVGNLQLYALQSGLGDQPGFVVRGSIEYGPFFVSDREVIGPAFIEAYNLEASVAKVARVIAGPRLLQQISERRTAHYSSVTRAMFYRSRDGLFSFTGGPLADDVDQLNAVRDHAPAGLHAKYEEIIDRARVPHGEGDLDSLHDIPSVAALTEAADSVRQALSAEMKVAYRPPVE